MNEKQVQDRRQALLAAYAAAVRAVEGENVIADWLRANPVNGDVALIALGKAAGAMALSSVTVVGNSLSLARRTL